MTMLMFKVFAEPDSVSLEQAMNRWAHKLPAGTKIRRTQLAVNGPMLYALVNFELPEER